MRLDELQPIIVAGLDYAVIPDYNNKLIQEKNRVGEHNQIQLTLEVCVDIPLLLQAQTLLHELFHAIGAVYMEGRLLDEVDVAALSQGFFQVLRDNPDLVEFLTNPTVEPANDYTEVLASTLGDLSTEEPCQ